MSTLLAELVRRQTTSSVVSVLGRTIDQIAAEIVHDLLRDPDFRAEMQQLMRLALQQAIKDFNEPAPPDDFPRHRLQQLDRIETLLSEIPNRSLDVRGTTGGKATTEIVKP